MADWDVVKWPIILGDEACVTAVEVRDRWAGEIQVGAQHLDGKE